MIAAQIVNALLEDGEDPKDFLAQNRDLGLDQIFVAHGWVVRGPMEYGKMSDDNMVRWIVDIDDRSTDRATTMAATFTGEKLFTGQDYYGHPTREWRRFEIPDYVTLSSWMTVDDFVNEIEAYLADHTGPDAPEPPEPSYDDVDD